MPRDQGVARYEMLAEPTFCDGKAGAHMLVTGLQNLGRRAPRQKLRITRHIIDQVIERLRRIRQQGRTLNMCRHVSVTSTAVCCQILKENTVPKPTNQQINARQKVTQLRRMPVATSIKPQRLAHPPWTETLSVDIVNTPNRSKKR